MWEWGAMRDERVAEAEGGGGTALWATGAEEEAPAVEVFMTLDMVGRQTKSDEEDEELVQLERVLDRETRVEILRLRCLSAIPPPRCISATGLKLRLYPPNLHPDKVGSTL